MIIFCNSCIEKREARLALGMDVYPVRKDLRAQPFWVCNTCNNFIGCHPSTIKPLGRMGHTKIFCACCVRKRKVRLTLGTEVYPKYISLHSKPYWICDECNNFVGCHPNTIKPLGCIATKHLRQARAEIHGILDPIWQSGTMSRSRIYKELSNKLGWKYHTASIRNITEAKQVINILSSYRITVESIEGNFI